MFKIVNAYYQIFFQDTVRFIYDSTKVCQADSLGFNSPSGYKVGRPGHSKYVWVGQYEPSCFKFPSSVLEDKL